MCEAKRLKPETDLQKLSEEKREDILLARLAKNGDLEAQEILIRKYAWIARSKARKFFVEGGTYEDLAQEGMIGIWKAIRDYDNTKNDSFLCYINMCVSSEIRDAIRTQTRIKHKTLNEAVSLSDFDKNVAPEYITDPITNYLEKEGTESFYEKIETLCTEQQLEVLKYYFEGYTYNEIAKLTGLSHKKVDNVLAAVKSKIKKNKELFLE